MPSRFSAQIVRMCAGVAVPLLVSAGILLYQNADTERVRLEDDAASHAHDAAVLIDRDLRGLVAALDVVAALPQFLRGDLSTFGEFANNISLTTDCFVVVATVDGQQVINTRVPWDTPLPRVVDPHVLELNQIAARTGVPVVSNYMVGSAINTPLYSVRRAVTVEDGRVLILILSRPLNHLSDLLKAKQVGENSWITLIDREGTILARTIAPETIGRRLVPAAMTALVERRANSRQVSPEGIPNFAAYRQVGETGWTVAVAVPDANLLRPMHWTLAKAGALIVIALLLSTILALSHGRKIARSVQVLASGARALGRGEPLRLTRTAVREMNEIAEALAQAKRDLDEKQARQEATEADLRRAKAAAEQAVRAKSRFLASASHDLRQPLQGLTLYLGILRGAVTASAAKVMDSAETCLASLTALLNDMLDLNKFDSGAVKVTMTDIPMGSLLERLRQINQPMAANKGLELWTVPSSVTIRTDAAMIERILQNFLTNAIRYTGTGKVLVGCRRRDRTLLIQVWDTGIGVPEGELESIFEDFYQVGNPERSQANGTGLGLAIVKRAAALLDIPVTVRSQHGKGSVFAIEVPLANSGNGLTEV
jgi:signal transduction histidine kinase